MSNFICTAFYSRNKAGWSENYFITADSYNTAMSKLQLLNTDRLALAQPEVFCDGLRVSDVEISRDSLVADPTTPKGTLASTASTTFPELVIQIRFSAGTSKRAIRTIRCFPETNITDGAYVPDAAFSLVLNTWMDNVVTNTNIRTLNPVAGRPPKYTFTPITANSVEGLNSKKVGRPFELFHGRRVIR